MRIYINPLEAIGETERDLWEMGVRVHPQTMQDKDVATDPDFETVELEGYGFKIARSDWSKQMEEDAIAKVLGLGHIPSVQRYIELEFADRTSGEALNPGHSYLARPEVWEQFLHNGVFAYTYSERMSAQLPALIEELRKRPNSRQGIISIHSNICVGQYIEHKGPARQNVIPGADMLNRGGTARIPCSMYYQFLIRNGRLDLIYTMRSCDYLTHFVVDLMLAMRLQKYVADKLNLPTGQLTWFAGSLHAYRKDMKARGVF